MKKLRVREAMTPDPVTVNTETPVTEIARIMVQKGIGGVPVEDDSGGLAGVVTESDLIAHDSDIEFPSFVHFLTGYVFVPGSLHRFEEKFKKAVGNKAGDLMTAEPVTVQADDAVEDVANMMSEKKLKRFPVMEGERLVGIITMADIVRLISRDVPMESEE
jgi:predicted transcriptional regulator